MKINGRKVLGCQGQTFVLLMSPYDKRSGSFISQNMVPVTLKSIVKLRVVNSTRIAGIINKQRLTPGVCFAGERSALEM